MLTPGPTRLDLSMRRAALRRPGRVAALALSPLFSIGLPGGYIAIAYLTARWLRRRRRRGGAAIVMSAWLGWLAHRGMKRVVVRARPRRRGDRTRWDSFPSGHTTGVTAVSLTAAMILRREGVLSDTGATCLAVAPPAIMGAYRVLADDHWATDVLGGWALGAAVALACVTGSTRRPREPRLVRRAAPTSATPPGRAGSPAGRARTARPSAR